jgi:hypothetical protein
MKTLSPGDYSHAFGTRSFRALVYSDQDFVLILMPSRISWWKKPGCT